MISVDALIVGGGPAGLAVAHAAALGGSRVLLVHRDREIGRPVRTSGGSWEAHLRKLEIPERLYHRIDRILFAAPGFTADKTCTTDRCVILDVTATYRYLADLATAAGATVRTACRFLATRTLPDGSFLSTVAAPEGPITIRSRFLIEASGVARAVSEPLGIAPRFGRLGVGAEYDFENLTPHDRTGVLFVGSRFAPAGYGWAFPTRDRRIRVGIGVLHPDVPMSVRPHSLLEDFLTSGEPARLGLHLGRVVEKHFGAIPSQDVPDRLVHDRVLCVGDSVCQATPLVGEGIRYCIEAGRVAGAALASAVAADVDGDPDAAEHLAAYENWWQRTYRKRFHLAQRVNERVARFGDADWDQFARFLDVVPADLLAQAFRMEAPRRRWAAVSLRHPLTITATASRLIGV